MADLSKYAKWKKIDIAVDLLKEVYGTLQMYVFIQEEACQTLGMSLWLSYQAKDREAVDEIADYGLAEIIRPALGWLHTYGKLIFPNNESYAEFFLAAEKSFLQFKVLNQPQVPQTQGIHIVTKPSYALITIDGEETEKLTPEQFDLSTGNHTLLLELEDYKDIGDSFYVPRGEHVEKTYSFESARQGIHIASVPYLAHIWINGEDTEQLTPEMIDLSPGPVTIKLTREGYEDYETEETIPDGEYIEVIYHLVEA